MSAPAIPRPSVDYIECVECARRGVGLHIDLDTGLCRRCTPTTRQGN